MHLSTQRPKWSGEGGEVRQGLLTYPIAWSPPFFILPTLTCNLFLVLFIQVTRYLYNRRGPVLAVKERARPWWKISRAFWQRFLNGTDKQLATGVYSRRRTQRGVGDSDLFVFNMWLNTLHEIQKPQYYAVCRSIRNEPWKTPCWNPLGEIIVNDIFGCPETLYRNSSVQTGWGTLFEWVASKLCLLVRVACWQVQCHPGTAPPNSCRTRDRPCISIRPGQVIVKIKMKRNLIFVSGVDIQY